MDSNWGTKRATSGSSVLLLRLNRNITSSPASVSHHVLNTYKNISISKWALSINYHPFHHIRFWSNQPWIVVCGSTSIREHRPDVMLCLRTPRSEGAALKTTCACVWRVCPCQVYPVLIGPSFQVNTNLPPETQYKVIWNIISIIIKKKNIFIITYIINNNKE